MSVYRNGKTHVNPKQASPEKKSANDSSSGPVRPQVVRPRRRTYVKLPADVLADHVREKRLIPSDVMVVMSLVDRCWALPSGQRSLSFKSEETVAAELKVDERTVRRAVARLRKCDDLVTIYAARMVWGDKRGGHFANNVYDFTGLFLLCGEKVVPHSMKSVREMLNAEGRWVRGLKRLDANGDVVAEERYDKPVEAEKAPESAPGNPDERTSVSSTTEANPTLTDPPTGGHACPPNKTPPSVVIENQTTHNAPRPRLRSAVDDLDGHSQIVFGRLIALGYSRFKAVYDLKKWGSVHVEARIDFVTRDARGVKDVRCMINHWMDRDLRDAFGSKPVKPKPSPQAAPERPQSAPQKPVLNAPPAPEKPQSAPPAMSKAERLAALRAEVLSYPVSQVHRARLAMLADRDERVLIQDSPQAAVKSMKPGALIALRDRLVRLARKDADDPDEIFADD